MIKFSPIVAAVISVASSLAEAAEPAAVTKPAKVQYSPYAGEELPRQLLWGDMHLHSNLSQDAWWFGVSLGPEQAFRFARGETIRATHGQLARLSRPLDFLVLTDHAEALGVMELVKQGDPRLMGSKTFRQWHQSMQGGPKAMAKARRDFNDRENRGDFSDAQVPEALQKSIWANSVAIAERFNEPGRFSTLHGYEWTSAPGGSNLHRVLVYRDNADKVSSVLPFSAADSDKPKDLWRYMANYEDQLGGRVLAIPHNGNLSNGLMFPLESSYGDEPLDREYALARQRWEPVVEVTQIKGDGETHPLLSPEDEFADYETWDFGNFAGAIKKPEMLAAEYARSALGRGLLLEQKLGANPYQFGMIGSTDSHTAFSTAEENNFFGKHSLGQEPGPKRLLRPMAKTPEVTVHSWQQVSSGYTGVWAKQNSRTAIWDAIYRKEVYATTGSRISVRLFGGWGFQPQDAHSPDLAKLGYRKGVPMGGSLTKAAAKTAPSFLIAASKDPLGANLDRVQIIKGSLGKDGKIKERVFNVAWSQAQQRKLDSRGKIPPVGSTLVAGTSQWDNSIGAAELTKVWQDPEFDPAEPAFYYARVIEIPTPRWPVYDAERFNVPLPKGAETSTQERAYTSPIWYKP
ncbi:MAG: DUF3604 domain-containing protein [Cellvibrionaceae bacterium]|nr:DUF3604 domain-containing protein [Cellvibrionaceae bacterium]